MKFTYIINHDDDDDDDDDEQQAFHHISPGVVAWWYEFPAFPAESQGSGAKTKQQK